MMNFILFVVFVFIFVLVLVAVNFKDLVEAYREIQTITPRCAYSIRAARSAWMTWDEPTIVELRKVLEGSVVTNQRALERALFEVAHQKEGEE